MTDIILSGETWKYPVKDLDPGKTGATLLKFKGEAAMMISFSAGGKHYLPKSEIYIENSAGYRARIRVNKDLSVDMKYGDIDIP